MSLISWGNYPKIKNTFICFDKLSVLKKSLEEDITLIPHGNGRSYGDSALYKKIVKVRYYNRFLSFDKDNGILHVQAGVLLSEILDVIVPEGWFLQVTPGTKLITIGGAIASDVHGKNHHVAGCFSECVEFLTLLLADGDAIQCSKTENVEHFRATCGGMGLTGVILDAKILLKRISSVYIDQETIRTRNLKETFLAFEEYKDTPYSVAWIDCLAKGKNLGKSLLMTGDFCNDKKLSYQEKRSLTIPFYFPSFFLNKLSIKLFNLLYYHKVRAKKTKQIVGFNTFFYPLDSIDNWNKMYGKNGFTQYQFIIPRKDSFDALTEILTLISMSGKGSFLAVLKLYGKANENYLSFPMEGYSLALDFKIEKGLFQLLDKLDEVVLQYNGRIYLAKDVRVSKRTFEKGYPKVGLFRSFRKKNKMDQKFHSLQSKRLGI